MLIKDESGQIIQVEQIEAIWDDGKTHFSQTVSGEIHKLSKSTYVKLLAWWEANANFL